jgi:hypothetical protein
VNNIFIVKTIMNKYLGYKRGRKFWCFVDFEKEFDFTDRKACGSKL